MRAGYANGRAARRRCRPGDLADLCHGRRARRRRRSDGDPLLWRHRFLHRLSRRCESVHRRRARRHRVAAGSHARRHPDRPDRGLLVGVFLGRIQGRLGFRRARPGVDILPDRPAWPARGGEGLMTAASGLAVDNTSKSRDFWAPLLKDAVLAALVAVLLALPLVGLQTYDIGGGALGIRTHFDWVAIAGAAVFGGRIALRVLRQRYDPRPMGETKHFAFLAVWAARQAVPLTLAGVAFARCCLSCRSRRAIWWISARLC